MSEEAEVRVYLPWDVIEKGKGLSLDIGGSAVKLLYLHKDDWKAPSERKQSDKGCLRLATFSREDLDKGLEDTKEKIQIMTGRSEVSPMIATTGIGGSQYYKQIREAFNIETKNLAEQDCFAEAFIYLLKNLPRKDVLFPLHEPAFEHTSKHLERYRKVKDKMQSVTNVELDGVGDNTAPTVQRPAAYTHHPDLPLCQEQAIFPCLLLACGSAFGSLKVEEDGSYSLASASNRGGKTFCGLGSLLTGCKTYDELLSLCEKGSSNKVAITNIQATDNLNTEDEESVYTAAKDEDMDETVLYYFGHAVGKDRESFKPEDVARCLLEMTIQDLVQLAHSTCLQLSLKHVFFCGSFVNHPLVRRLITREFLYRDVILSMFMPMGQPSNREQISFHFLQHGSHLGALGAYLNAAQPEDKKAEASSDTK